MTTAYKDKWCSHYTFSHNFCIALSTSEKVLCCKYAVHMKALPKNAIYLKLLVKFLVSAQRKRYNLVVLRHSLFNSLPKRQHILEVINFLKLNVSADSTLAVSSQKCSFRTPALWRQQKLVLTLIFLLLLARSVPFLPSHSHLQVAW